jgi:hypothetical protein
MDSDRRIQRMERRTFLKASVGSLTPPLRSGPAEVVSRKDPGDTGLLPGTQSLPTMYAPRLVAMIEAADSMVIRRATAEPESGVVLSFRHYDTPRSVERVMVPFKNLRTGLYVRGPVGYRLRVDTAGVKVGVRSTLVFDERACLMVYFDEAQGVKDVRGHQMWIGNTIVLARPMSME